MNRLMHIGAASPSRPVGGRDMLSDLHRESLSEILGGNFVARRLEFSPKRVPTRALHGHIDGVTKESIGSVIRQLREQQISVVYLDGSNLGALARHIKSALSHVKLLTFFHNVEARFFLGAFRTRPTLRAAAVLLANYIAERFAVKYSDRLITLSQRDSDLLQRVYGRPATDILPMALRDHSAGAVMTDPPASGPAPALFVGGNFYANFEGISWFIREVAPRIGMPVCVVGHGMEALTDTLEIPAGLRIMGGVKDLAPYYRAAKVVIAPIFDGSGMKTKVAEALMYGKAVIGTPEAFSGYESIKDEAGWVCNSAEDFIAAFDLISEKPVEEFDISRRNIYDRLYSPQALRRRLHEILMSIDQHKGDDAAPG